MEFPYILQEGVQSLRLKKKIKSQLVKEMDSPMNRLWKQKTEAAGSKELEELYTGTW